MKRRSFRERLRSGEPQDKVFGRVVIVAGWMLLGILAAIAVFLVVEGGTGPSEEHGQFPQL